MQKNLVIFLIDDDTDDQEVFSFAMEELYPSATCVFANDGVYALQKLNTGNFIPHVIFIDMNMPRINGIQCLTEIKKLEHIHHIPAYMYSTSATPPIIEECLKIGAAGFIKKEVNVDVLQKKLLQVLSQFQTQSE
jgi:CheY-like chemotaxis protein